MTIFFHEHSLEFHNHDNFFLSKLTDESVVNCKKRNVSSRGIFLRDKKMQN